MEAQRQSMVTEQMKNLQNLISRLDDASNALEERLKGVVRPPEISKQQERNGLRETLSVPLAEELSAIYDKLITLNSRLMHLTERIEV